MRLPAAARGGVLALPPDELAKTWLPQLLPAFAHACYAQLGRFDEARAIPGGLAPASPNELRGMSLGRAPSSRRSLRPELRWQPAR